jgi:hypothetical protein
MTKGMKYMKILKSSFCIILAAAFAGCATHSTVVVNQPVGPDLAHPRVNLNQGNGQLMVYTALEVANPVSADYPTHTSYVIYDSNGKLLRHVDNRSGSFYQTPKMVSLPAGEYKVEGRATNSGQVDVPVIIKENKTTTVDLEGTNLPQHKPTGAGQWIRLPDGQVIGMRGE